MNDLCKLTSLLICNHACAQHTNHMLWDLAGPYRFIKGHTLLLKVYIAKSSHVWSTTVNKDCMLFHKEYKNYTS